MTKTEFMVKLDGALARLPYAERKDILSDFEEHFTNGAAAGKTEAEVASELGDPVALAAQYTEGLPEPKPEVGAAGVARGVFAAICMLFFDVCIALPVIAVLFSIWIGLWAAAIGIFAAAFGCMVVAFISGASVLSGIGVFMIGISLLAFAVLLGIGMVYVSIWFFKGIIGYVKAHVRIIKGGAKT